MDSDLKVKYKISKNMLIGEIIQKYPETIDPLMGIGVQCVGCGAASYETLENGLKSHGMSDEDVDNAVKTLNEAVEKSPAKKEVAKDVTITEKAAEKLLDVMKSEDKEGFGLRILVMPGGCSGMKYGFEFEKEPKDGDKIFVVKGAKFFIDQESLEKIKGATIDYSESLQNAGFKIDNPNATSTCGCGESFS
tara:strand:- start:1141 stop:1716 length:576 start_codon:yes stop_codon:yes gene_type:complete